MPTENLTQELEIGVSNIQQNLDKVFPHVLIATRTWGMKGDTRELSNWDVLNCSLHYATYKTTVASSNDRSIILDYTVMKHGQSVRTGVLEAIGSLPLFSLSGNSSDYGHLMLLDSLREVLRGYLDSSNTMFIKGLSDITRTPLMFSKELVHLTAIFPDDFSKKPLSQQELWDLQTKSYPEEAYTATTFNHSLAFAIETLYHNITLSLLSRESFLAHPGQIANVTTERWLNQYSYDNRNLLLSYGIALALGLLACIYGCTSIYRSECSYSNKFSTILRTTKGHLEGFDALLTDADRGGADPLTGRLAKAKLVLGRGVIGDEGLVGGDGREDGVELERQQQQQQRKYFTR